MDDIDVPIHAVKRSYDVVDELCDRDEAGVTELAHALELPKSTVHNHLRTLNRLGYVVKKDGQYRLSTKYLFIGRTSRNSRDVFFHGREKIENLKEELHHHVQLIIEENGQGAILLAPRWQYENLLPAVRHVYPTHLYLHSNAPGKAILAHLPDDRVSTILDRHGLLSRTENTITDESTLHEELATIKKRGYALDDGELIEGIVGVGVPIATDEEVYGAIGVYGSATEIRTDIEDGELLRLIQEKAEAIRADIVFDTMK
jgi:DNA-binding IclR family transcriptional regulator